MRVELSIENCGFEMTKSIELPAAPVPGLVLFNIGGPEDGSKHPVEAVFFDCARGVYVAKITHSDFNTTGWRQDYPAAYLLSLNSMRAGGWEVENEETLRGYLKDRCKELGQELPNEPEPPRRPRVIR